MRKFVPETLPHEVFSQTCDTQKLSQNAWGFTIETGGEFAIYVESPEKISSESLAIAKLLREILDMQQTILDPQPPSIQETTGNISREQLKNPYDFIIGKSPSLIEALQKIDKISGVDNIPVLIQGESGTGKELIARAIHQYGPRKDRVFLEENCAAITETLLECELFGHVKGAFTGAISDKQGLFEIANGGTLFLDEVGDMSIGMQKKLLRALQDGEIRAVGGRKVKKVDVRIIAATNKNLKQEVENNNFREDLYYRLNGLTINLPPLRERGKDVWLLFQFFYEKISKEMGIPIKSIDPQVKDNCLQYQWPGNIRELQNEVKRIIALSDEKITMDLLSFCQK